MADNLSVIKSRLSYNSKHSKVTFSVLSLGSSFMNEQERHKYEQLKQQNDQEEKAFERMAYMIEKGGLSRKMTQDEQNALTLNNQRSQVT